MKGRQHRCGLISGQTEKKKKKRRKRKYQVKSVPAQNTGKTTSIELFNVNNDNIKKEASDVSDALEATKISIINDPGKTVERNTEIIDLYKVRMELEGKIAEKRGQFVIHQQNAGDVVHIKSGKLVDIVMNIEKIEDEKNMKVEEQLTELESKMRDLKQKKIDLVKESKADEKRIQKFECEKQKLEKDIEKDVKIKEKEENDIKKEIVDLERKLEETKTSIKNLPNDVAKNITIQLPFGLNEDFLEFIEHDY